MFYPILAYALLNLVYLAGQISAALILNVTESHYFLGFGRQLFAFKVRDGRFSVGLYIPIVGLSRIYAVVNGEKQRARYAWEFFDRPVGRRLLATLGGPASLLIAGLLIFIGITYITEESFISKEEVNKHGIYPSESAAAQGLRRGDRIVAVNGKEYSQYEELIDPEIFNTSGSYYTVRRGDTTLDVTINDPASVGHGKNFYFVSLLVPFEIAAVQPSSPAERAGIRKGDRITKANDQSIIKFFDLLDALQHDDDGVVALEVERGSNDSLEVLNLSVAFDNEGKLGIWPQELIHYTTARNSLPAAIQKGTREAFSVAWQNVTVFMRVMTGSLAPVKSAGPISIAPSTRPIFWWIAGIFAMLFAFWNLLPLPKSAFWEIIPLIYEGAIKKRYPYSVFKNTIKFTWLLVAAGIIWMLLNDLATLFS